jgi:hypothetical protein
MAKASKTVQRPKPTGRPVTIPPPAKKAAPAPTQTAPPPRTAPPARTVPPRPAQTVPPRPAPVAQRAAPNAPEDPNHPLNAPPAERWPERPAPGADDGIPAALKRKADNTLPPQTTQALAEAKGLAPPEQSAAVIRSDRSAVVKTNGGGNALAALEASGDTGFETVTQQDLMIPRLTILQDLSPQVKPNRSEYIEGAGPGHIFDTATGFLANEIEVIPAYFERRYLEWQPDRGGFVADHGTNNERYVACGGDGFSFAITPEGNLIQPTMTFYVINVTEGALQCVLPMSSVFMKHGRHWMSVMSSYIIPGTSQRGKLWSRSWTMKTIEQQNDKGDWWGWQIDPLHPIEQYGEEIVRSVFSFREILKGGAYVSAAQLAEDQSDSQGIADNAGANAAM